jgi:quercetin dioxygenase-like cupin family protein
MTGAARPATHARIYQEPPQQQDADGTRHWITRAANFAVVVTDAKAGNVMARADNPDEYMVLLPPRSEATIEAGSERIDAKGETFTIVPPGPSRVTVTHAGMVVRVFSNRAQDIVAAAGNAGVYADGAPEVAPLKPWPDPVGGFRLRHYRLADLPSKDPSPLKMRVFQSSNLMINIFERWPQPRDETKLSPHSHDDFEQASLGLAGAFTHHLRYPWTPDKSQWREDEHAHYAASPSVLVIPARVLHTSQNVGNESAWLIDIFAPPRTDFASKPGFVMNGAEYPMPA